MMKIYCANKINDVNHFSAQYSLSRRVGVRFCFDETFIYFVSHFDETNLKAVDKFLQLDPRAYIMHFTADDATNEVKLSHGRMKSENPFASTGTCYIPLGN